MTGTMTVVMVVMMVVMMGGMLAGAAWAFVRRASRAERLNEPDRLHVVGPDAGVRTPPG